MLTRTFRHIPGVGERLEQKIWKSGRHSWGDYLSDPLDFLTSRVTPDHLKHHLESSLAALETRDHRAFTKLNVAEAWRAYPEFSEKTLFLDIETDGGVTGDSITMVGLYDGFDFNCLVRGERLDEFPEMIRDCSMLVTFYGSAFDVPMLKRRFPEVDFNMLHLDLCFAFRKAGIRGGLKKIEKHFGMARDDETVGLSGYDAIRLWNEYLRGNGVSLETLKLYNREDVVNLKTLTEICYGLLMESTLREAGIQVPESTSRS